MADVWAQGPPGFPTVGWRQAAEEKDTTAAEWFRDTRADYLEFHDGECALGKVGGEHCTCQPDVRYRDSPDSAG